MTALPPPPAHLEPYVAALGTELAVEFLLQFGGAALYIADKPTERSALVKALGKDAAVALSQVHREQGLPEQVPTGKKWIAQVLFAQGCSIAQIARRIHMTEATVRSYTAHTPRTDPRQIPLI